ncbi:tellurite resistance TerB family protein [Parahaliea mediterranea]|uniref:Tellurite resistance TerB family protein n=1 Tax=Parahaliea mediterranea TaxID=651086 RepID=A0A939DBM1_9GAMM|nr:tellurite resistance TerB family protein [Parahaliea mediterranea]MBN7795268.1 tellurite resistance TerB family protein [Parahaliea mediterranea]
MDIKGLLNQVLASGNELASTAAGKQAGGMSDMTKGAIGGAVGGSLLPLLMGNKKTRKMGAKAAKLGGTAALGALAYKVYNDWQAGQQSATVTSAPAATIPPDTPQHSMNVLRAMLAAAKADGHVDDAEQARIYKAVQAMGATREVSAFVETELARPLDPAEVARGITCPEEASEVYLASLLMVDEQGFMERAYLQELARELGLAPELVARLESQVA